MTKYKLFLSVFFPLLCILCVCVFARCFGTVCNAVDDCVGALFLCAAVVSFARRVSVSCVSCYLCCILRRCIFSFSFPCVHL